MGVTAQNEGAYADQDDYVVDTPEDVEPEEDEEGEEEVQGAPETFAEQHYGAPANPLNPPYGDPVEVQEAVAEAKEEAEADEGDEDDEESEDLNPPEGDPEEVAAAKEAYDERRAEELAEEREGATSTDQTGTVDTSDPDNVESAADVTPEVPEDAEVPEPVTPDEAHDAVVNPPSTDEEPAPDEPVNGGPVAETPENFDPDDHTVPEVQAFIAEHPEQEERVLQLEAEGQARKGLLGS